MGGEWVAATLGEVTDLLTGFPFKSDRYVDDFSAPRLLRGDNIAQGVLRWDGVKRWPEVDTEELARYSLREGDVVLAMDRPWIEAGLKYAAVREVDLPAFLVQRVARFRGINGLDSRFLKYVIGSPAFTTHILAIQTGTAVPHISGNQIKGFEFLLPPPEEQRAIAHILGTLDDKIELNRRRNQTLEAMARALFQDWFIDFGPVRAKMAGHEPYLPAELWRLFPERLDEAGKPEGWEMVPASELIEFNPSEPLRKGTHAPYLDMASLPTTGSSSRPPITRSFGSGMRFRNGDTLMARITPCLENGKTAFVQCLPDDAVGWGSTEFIVMRSRTPVPAEYTYLLARDTAFRDHAIRSMTGTSGRQRAQADSVAAFKLASPSDDAIWHAFSKLIAPMFESIKVNAAESDALAQLRDTLLPKLISGELWVADAEKFVEHVSP
ncbi:restriction endonuclease subunit S [Denitromonas iodatirespirans]|uniref:Restriction endonuclease subunit S n=1 Tax=Denitromonas iodatirespirans TaxID=2795389 RepID=A0A944D8P6_DENI1|nr:restriction endonuclease subunit S [Denitromonas iodatirespirans]MBT0959972.1 restriction endonuclease subunit S [Denitromonas iodatirespirans]